MFECDATFNFAYRQEDLEPALYDVFQADEIILAEKQLRLSDASFANLPADLKVIFADPPPEPIDDNEIVVVAPSFDDSKDYCGSVGTGWVPDYIFDVQVAEACFWHDINYGPGSDMSREEADYVLMNDIARLLIDNGYAFSEAWAIATVFYQGVRQFGEDAYQGRGNPN